MSRIYYMIQWKRLRAQFLREHPLCAMCMWEGRHTPASEVDHTIAIEQGGEPFDA